MFKYGVEKTDDHPPGQEKGLQRGKKKLGCKAAHVPWGDGEFRKREGNTIKGRVKGTTF